MSSPLVLSTATDAIAIAFPCLACQQTFSEVRPSILLLILSVIDIHVLLENAHCIQGLPSFPLRLSIFCSLELLNV